MNRGRNRNPSHYICCAAAPVQHKVPAVVFVLGGPGSGKGTQCAKLVKEFGYTHVTVGDLLRAEAATASEQGLQVARIIRDGGIVPSEITMSLLREKLATNASHSTLLIDGFPRVMDQALAFERSVSLCNFVLFFNCAPAEMRKRILARAKSSGRVDDNSQVIDARLNTYMNQTMPVIEYYENKGLLRRVDSNLGGPDKVYENTRTLFLQENL